MDGRSEALPKFQKTNGHIGTMDNVLVVFCVSY